ncbi:hypothetical protein [Pantoea ananatis]|uniref:hypothetical protein n=1 Tax=Pantoea ananas TaxID=553 RepID=UPI0009169936|nr:hypothetical protein [Pantoea ananatis]SFY15258.1 hypothetical protein SAMN03097714_4653 [Pantoea ananatis]
MKDDAAHALAEGIRQAVTSAYDQPQTVGGMPVLQIQQPGSLPEAVDAPFLPDGVTVWSVLLPAATAVAVTEAVTESDSSCLTAFYAG